MTKGNGGETASPMEIPGRTLSFRHPLYRLLRPAPMTKRSSGEAAIHMAIPMRTLSPIHLLPPAAATEGSSGEAASPMVEIQRRLFSYRTAHQRNMMRRKIAVHHSFMAWSRKRVSDLVASVEELRVRLEDAKRNGAADSELGEMERELHETLQKEAMIYRSMDRTFQNACSNELFQYSQLKSEEVEELEWEMLFESLDSGSSETSHLTSKMEAMKIEGSERVMEIQLKSGEVKEVELEVHFESLDSGSSETSRLASKMEAMKIEDPEGVMGLAD